MASFLHADNASPIIAKAWVMTGAKLGRNHGVFLAQSRQVLAQVGPIWHAKSLI